MKLEMKRLAFEMHELEPYISSKTMKFHYEEYYKVFLEKLNSLIKGTVFEDSDALTLIKITSGQIFINAVQVWNHEFYFEALTPNQNEISKGPFLDTINGCFGSVQFFKDAIKKYAISLINPGWIWVVWNSEGFIEIVKGNNTGHPVRRGFIPLLNCDMWEHAYVSDYQCYRDEYIEAFLKVVNWNIIEMRYQKALKGSYKIKPAGEFIEHYTNPD